MKTDKLIPKTSSFKKELSESGKYFEDIFNKAKDPEYQLKQKILQKREENIKNYKKDIGI